MAAVVAWIKTFGLKILPDIEQSYLVSMTKVPNQTMAEIGVPSATEKEMPSIGNFAIGVLTNKIGSQKISTHWDIPFTLP